MKKEYAEEVAARIIEQLQQGTAPWQKPWKPGELRLPYNPTTGKEYRGMNSLWLHMQGYGDPRWMTYNQAADAIGHDPGQHAAYVGSWIKALQEDPREIFRAAADAEKIAGYVMAFELEQEQTQQRDAQPTVAAEQNAGQDSGRVLHHPPENPMPSRTYLAVPYAEKDQAKAAAKAAGFKLEWDKEQKAWCAPAGADLTTLARWKADAQRVIQKPAAKSPEEQFAEALNDAGLQLDGLPVMDGKLYRVPVVGDKGGETSGAYAGHLTGQLPGGFIQNYKTGEVVHWKAEGTVAQVSPEERARLAAEAAQQREKREADRQVQQDQTAAAAAALWAEATAATADNAYCKAKGIENPGELGLRVVPDAVSPALAAHGIKIAKTAKEAKELREADPNNRVFKAGDLLIPGMDRDGKLWTLQSVNPYFKSFMKGGRKHGLFTVAGAANAQKALDADPAAPLVLAEGYATANTVAQATGKPVIVAFDSGNLDAVARELRERYPSRPMFIASDNDHNAPKQIGPDGNPRPNVGLEKAKEAAEKYGAGVVAPQFKDGEKGSDWNDYAAGRGSDEARRHFAEQMVAARVEATIAGERLVTLARTREMEVRNDPTTSPDDREWSKEHRKSAEMLATATAQLGEVLAKTTDGMVGTRKSARAPAAIKAEIERSVGKMKDEVKQERQEVLYRPAETTADTSAEKQKGVSTTPAKRPAKSRNRGVDAGL